MFPTFSGNSRRPRNVNLSGQKSTNPFAKSSGTPKPVADAAAERLQRQQERERKQAAQKIQRVWRGQRARSRLRSSYRIRFDELYSNGRLQLASIQMPDSKLPEALALLLFFFDGSSPQDHYRLAAVAEGVDAALDTKLLAPTPNSHAWRARMHKLAQVLVQALDRSGHSQPSDEHSDRYLQVLSKINTNYPSAQSYEMRPYYTMLAHRFQQAGLETGSPPGLRVLVSALVLPLMLGGAMTTAAYREFAVSFLTQASNRSFEVEIPRIAPSIEIEALSAAIVTHYPVDRGNGEGQEQRLWLFAHFIHLLRATSSHSQSNPTINLKALYIQLSALSNRISIASSPTAMTDSDGSTDDGSLFVLPRYVKEQLGSLVAQEGISELLEKFTQHHSETEIHSEDASLIAAYTLTLIRSFPSQSDDIRMRLYLTDISTSDGAIPALKFFWDAMYHTQVFGAVKQDENAAQAILTWTRTKQGTFTEDRDNLGRDWRSILLFLELYSFVLRLTDDDDFFSALSSHMPNHKATSRLRQSGLTLDHLVLLSQFLKHLGFTLIYHSAAYLPDEGLRREQGAGGGLSRQGERAEGLSVIPGVDYTAFKGIVITTMRMLYERDSRRPFLRPNHWLMVSRFDMKDFEEAVVLEEQRQYALREQEDDEEGEETAAMDENDLDEDEYRVLSHAGFQRSRHARMELLRRQQKQKVRERALAQVAPKLEILRNMPFVIPFEVRVKIFRQLVQLDKERRRAGYVDPDAWRAVMMGLTDTNIPSVERHHAIIKRGQLFADAMEQFYPLGDGLKEPIQITFVDQFDSEEAGIDGGGVTKEFLMSVTQEAFTDHYALFVANHKNEHYPNPCALDQRVELLRKAGCAEDSLEWKASIAELMKQYEFLGRIIGKCMYTGILIDIAFAGFFLLKWANSGSDTAYRANINDLREMDDELYQGMLSLKTYAGDVSELGLDFTLNDQVSLPDEPVMRTVTRNLIPNGENTVVTNENRPLYISYVARHRLVIQPYAQTKAFLRGLGAMIDLKWLSMFNQNELQRLVGGDSSEIDVADLRAHTQYGGVYVIGDDNEEHPTIKLFWQVMLGLEDHERRDVLKFVTSTPRAPLLGFSQLRPSFSIRDAGRDEERLPSSSTCVNLLKLPMYTSAVTLKEKLLYAAQSGAGFDLS